MKRTHSSMSADELELWRKRHGLSKELAGEKLGVTGRTIYYYLQGRSPIPETVKLLAEAIDDKATSQAR
jgi:transcriptional regulator with XRE-family HTH domain